jgi:hypothetical protein
MARPAGLGTSRGERERAAMLPEGGLAPGPAKRVTRPAGLEPATPGLEGRLYKPTRDSPRQSPLILRPVLRVGGNCFPPQTATACHTCVTPEPFDCLSTGNRVLGGRHV